MQVWPAIDLRGGKCVRLRQGDYRDETLYGEDPTVIAQNFESQGAKHLHLVDLDGARDGSTANREVVAKIVRSVRMECELGGGVRSIEVIRDYLSMGISRLVIGTKAIREPDWFLAMCREFPNKLVLGLDARNGRVATHGWLTESDSLAVDLAKRYREEPIAAIVYTDISKDGMLEGPNVDALVAMKNATPIPVIASGGVTSVSDVETLAREGLAGCIIGKAIYENLISVTEALAAAQRGKP